MSCRLLQIFERGEDVFRVVCRKILWLKFKVVLVLNKGPRHEDVALCLIQHSNMGIKLHEHLTSVLDGRELSASRLGLFTPMERANGTHCIEN